MIEMKIGPQRYHIEEITNGNLKVALNPIEVMGVIATLNKNMYFTNVMMVD